MLVIQHRPTNKNEMMLKQGTYAVWFNTPMGEGTGIVHFRDGVVSGGNDILTYSGSYETEADRFRAVIQTSRHTAGHPTVFGIDDLTLRLDGTCSTMFSRCSGRADEMPDLHFEALLIFSQADKMVP